MNEPRKFERLAATEAYRGMQAVNKTWFEKGEEEGQRAILYEQLQDRLGPLPPAVQERFECLPADRLAGLARAILRAQSLRDLGSED